jgi:hypothetical protein
MHKADRSIVPDLGCIQLLREKSDKGLVDLGETVSTTTMNSCKDCHNILFYDRPSRLEETASKPIRSRSTVTWHVLDGSENFFLRELSIEVRKFKTGQSQGMQIQGEVTVSRSTKNILKVVSKGIFNEVLVDQDITIMANLRDEILAAPVIGMEVKEFGIGLAFLEPEDTRSLSSNCTLEGAET